MRTIKSLTENDIRALRHSCQERNGDTHYQDRLILICEVALSDAPLDVDDWSGGGWFVSDRELAQIVAMSREEAYAAIVEALNVQSTSSAGTAELVERLAVLRETHGSAWESGWRGVVDIEAAAIIEELRSRDTEAARAALHDHGVFDYERDA